MGRRVPVVNPGFAQHHHRACFSAAQEVILNLETAVRPPYQRGTNVI